jgi:hypothetical protein
MALACQVTGRYEYCNLTAEMQIVWTLRRQ